MKSLFSAIAMVLALTIASPAHAENVCNAFLTNQFFLAGTYIKEPHIKKFWAQVLPMVRLAAAARSQTLRDYFKEHFDTFTLISGEAFGTDDVKTQETVDDELEQLAPIDRLAMGAKLKPNRFLAASAAYSSLYYLAIAVYEYDRFLGNKYDLPHPYSVSHPEFVRSLLQKLNHYDLEHAAQAFDHVDQQRKARVEEYMQRQEAAKAAEADAVEAEGDYDAIADQAETLPPKTFLELVEHEEPLASNVIYEVRMPKGDVYQVTLAPKMAEETSHRNKSAAFKMLRAFVAGHVDNAGLKRLYDVAPNLIELKAAMHGHRRIFGCLEGRKLRLIEMVDINATVATYHRRFSRNYCVER